MEGRLTVAVMLGMAFQTVSQDPRPSKPSTTLDEKRQEAMSIVALMAGELTWAAAQLLIKGPHAGAALLRQIV